MNFNFDDITKINKVIIFKKCEKCGRNTITIKCKVCGRELCYECFFGNDMFIDKNVQFCNECIDCYLKSIETGRNKIIN